MAPRRPLVALTALAAVVLLAGCASSSSTPASAPPADPNPSGADQIAMKDAKFSSVSVTVPRGTTITWTNQDPFAHTVTANDGSFDSGDMGQGATWSHTFTSPGTYHYYCKPHSSKAGEGRYQGMAGTVVVT